MDILLVPVFQKCVFAQVKDLFVIRTCLTLVIFRGNSGILWIAYEQTLVGRNEFDSDQVYTYIFIINNT